MQGRHPPKELCERNFVSLMSRDVVNGTVDEEREAFDSNWTQPLVTSQRLRNGIVA